MAGLIGSETALSLMLMLVNRGRMTLEDVLVRMTDIPAAMIGRGTTALRVGARADVTVIDTELVWTVDASTIMSKNHNTPLLGNKLKGRAVATVYRGHITYQE
jgi:dihydroorotase